MLPVPMMRSVVSLLFVLRPILGCILISVSIRLVKGRIFDRLQSFLLLHLAIFCSFIRLMGGRGSLLRVRAFRSEEALSISHGLYRNREKFGSFGVIRGGKQ